jgi:hypothetical protein
LQHYYFPLILGVLIDPDTCFQLPLAGKITKRLIYDLRDEYDRHQPLNNTKPDNMLHNDKYDVVTYNRTKH